MGRSNSIAVCGHMDQHCTPIQRVRRSLRHLELIAELAVIRGLRPVGFQGQVAHHHQEKTKDQSMMYVRES